MPDNNRPRGREKNVTGQGQEIRKRGAGNGGGPVGGGSAGGGSAGGGPSRPSGSGQRAVGGSSGGSAAAARGLLSGLSGKKKLLLIAVVVIALIIFFACGGGKIISGLLGGGGGISLGDSIASNVSAGSVSSGWTRTPNTGKLDTTIAAGAEHKRTVINGNGDDEVTVMIYMCGTDLESKYGMATADIKEILASGVGQNVNVIVYTGGCSQWKDFGISNSVNQIYKIANGKLTLLQDDKARAMTDPSTLSSFIKWCRSNYSANRYELIFWDHGGGSVSGYGYDEKNSKSGSMTLSGINTALKDAATTFDFIGFDACLMATAENALMLYPYADYLIASEETEPGIGWYYTDWMRAFESDPSRSTLEIGKMIVDGFVDTCASACPGQKATLSVIDLAELKMNMPGALSSFAESTSALLTGEGYKEVSDARNATREFAASSKIDQVDLVHLASNLDTKEGEALTKAILGAVKYNRTSTDMTNAYGLSIYFPYRKVSTVDSAVKTYDAIGMDDDYSACIKKFASLEVGGQAVSGGSSAQSSSMLGSLISGFSSGGQAISGTDAISSLLGSFIGGRALPIDGMDETNSSFISELSGMKGAAAYLNDNAFDSSKLVWKKNGRDYGITLSEEQWDLVNDLELSVFYKVDDGYFDLGLDNVFEFTDDGMLVGSYDGTWLGINGWNVAYYHESTFDDGTDYTITGRVPVLVNGARANLTLVFDNRHPHGYVAGVTFDYVEGETDTVAKSAIGLQLGDEIVFVADFYKNDGTYEDNYAISDPIEYNGILTISDLVLNGGDATARYRFTDIYNQNYWTPEIPA